MLKLLEGHEGLTAIFNEEIHGKRWLNRIRFDNSDKSDIYLADSGSGLLRKGLQR